MEFEKIYAIVRIAETKKAIKDQEEKVAILKERYDALYKERAQYGFGTQARKELAKTVNAAKLGLYSAEERLHRLQAEWCRLKYEYWELEDLFY